MPFRQGTDKAAVRRIIDQYDILLLDVCLTLMFGVDRFSESEDFAATYRELGGASLSNTEVQSYISGLWKEMARDYNDANRYDSFPDVPWYLKNSPLTVQLPPQEHRLLEQVIAFHEAGWIPDHYGPVLRELAETHCLGILSNINSARDRFMEEFHRIGAADLFEVIVFSSEHGVIKPSPRLFEIALEEFGAEPGQCLYIGDSLERDVAGAGAAGIDCVWVNPAGESLDGSQHRPAGVIREVTDLLSLAAVPAQ